MTGDALFLMTLFGDVLLVVTTCEVMLLLQVTFCRVTHCPELDSITFLLLTRMLNGFKSTLA
jgi:hypothetical protein